MMGGETIYQEVHVSVLDLLHTRSVEYEALLQRVAEILQKDERVVAAWLFGSRPR